MVYIYSLLAALVSFPFVFLAGGFLYSMSKSGEEGITWRINIGLAFDRLVAACLGYPDHMTICGYVGRKVQENNKFCWRLYVSIIEALPWWEKGHCVATAQKEKQY